MQIPTIKVVHPDPKIPFYWINVTDFDPEIHTKYEPAPAVSQKRTAKVTEPTE